MPKSASNSTQSSIILSVTATVINQPVISQVSVAAPNVNYYQQDELLKIKAAFDTMDLKWKTIGYVLMYYGCRRGECLGLKREAIDFKNHQLTISSCVLYNNEYGVRYTIIIKGKERYLFDEENGKWFVELKV